MRWLVALATSTATLASAGEAAGSAASTAPSASNGYQVQLVASGLMEPTSFVFVAGLHFHEHALYVSGAELGPKGPEFQILVFKDWNGQTFTSQKANYTVAYRVQVTAA